MKLLYVHLNIGDFDFSNELNESKFAFSELPEYANVSMKQARMFYDVVLIDQAYTDTKKPEINAFYELCKVGFPDYHRDPFWLLTLLRLYVLYLYVAEHNICPFVHMEYDNLVYGDGSELLQLQPRTYFTQVGPQCGSAGFMFCNSLESFADVISKIKTILTRGQTEVRKYTDYDHLSEMIMIDIICRIGETSPADYLPCLPWDKHADTLQMLYDGASYGQCVGGTNNGHGPGWCGHHHWVGRAILTNQITFNFDTVKARARVFSQKNGKGYKLCNLHIHSKQLDKYCFTSPFQWFDQIYLMNLERRKDRLAAAMSNLEQLGIDKLVDRFNAIDYSQSDHIRPHDRGKYGCTHTHLEILRQARAKGIKNVLVFEDDFELHRSASEINEEVYSSICELPIDWQIFYLSANPLVHPDSVHDYSEHLCLIKLAFTTHAVAVNHTAYSSALEDNTEFEQVQQVATQAVNKHINIDGYYMSCILPQGHSYMPKTLLFTQRQDYSDIDLRNTKIDEVLVERYEKFEILTS